MRVPMQDNCQGDFGIDSDLPIQAFSDSKSLVDSVHSSKTLEDNRLKIDICVLRDYLRLGEVEQIGWVDTKEQLADSLTKSGASAQNLLDALSYCCTGSVGH